MKVYVVPCDNDACGWYRLGYPVNALLAQGHDITIGDGHDPIPDDYDVVVIQRPVQDWLLAVIGACKSRGQAVVVEIDDDLTRLPTENVAARRLNGQRPGWHQHNVTRACEAADMVTVTTQALARRYAPHGRVAVIPNYVPEGWLALPVATRDDLVVGWAGSAAVHRQDLRQCRPWLRNVLVDTGARFHAVGDTDSLIEVGLRDDPLATWEPFVEIHGAYPLTVRAFTVGIAPLHLGPFAEAKSSLRLTQLAALGVPFVATPSRPYREFVQAANAGLLANYVADWPKHLRRLLTDEAFWVEQQQRLRAHARTLTYEENAWRWIAAWSRAAERVGAVA